jgi:hypothetical protein
MPQENYLLIIGIDEYLGPTYKKFNYTKIDCKNLGWK